MEGNAGFTPLILRPSREYSCCTCCSCSPGVHACCCLSGTCEQACCAGKQRPLAVAETGANIRQAPASSSDLDCCSNSHVEGQKGMPEVFPGWGIGLPWGAGGLPGGTGMFESLLRLPATSLGTLEALAQGAGWAGHNLDRAGTGSSTMDNDMVETGVDVDSLLGDSDNEQAQTGLAVHSFSATAGPQSPLLLPNLSRPLSPLPSASVFSTSELWTASPDLPEPCMDFFRPDACAGPSKTGLISSAAALAGVSEGGRGGPNIFGVWGCIPTELFSSAISPEPLDQGRSQQAAAASSATYDRSFSWTMAEVARLEQLCGGAGPLRMGGPRAHMGDFALAGSPDLMVGVLTARGVGARELAHMECVSKFFQQGPPGGPCRGGSFVEVAACKLCRADKRFVSWPDAAQRRLLANCGGRWILVLRYLEVLAQVYSESGLVEVGPDYSCMVTSDGALYVWGGSKKKFECLGKRAMQKLWQPRQLQHPLSTKRVTSVAAGPAFMAVVTGEGEVFTFGANEHGCLGLGTPAPEVASPQRVQALDSIAIKQVAAGFEFLMFLSREGRVYSAGRGLQGCLGHGNEEDRPIPQLVEVLASARVCQVAAGYQHTLAVTESGDVFSWGGGSRGQLGHGLCMNELLPRQIEQLSASFGALVLQVAAGAHHSVAASADGRVFLWGTPPNGIRSRETTADDATVRELDGLQGTRVVQVAAGALTTFIVGDLGEVFSFGCCFYGELGQESWGVVSLMPRRVESLKPYKVRQVASSWFRHTLCRVEGGEVVAMGLNSNGQCGAPFEEARFGMWTPRVVSMAESTLPP